MPASAKEQYEFSKGSENSKRLWAAHMVKPSTGKVYFAKQNGKMMKTLDNSNVQISNLEINKT